MQQSGHTRKEGAQKIMKLLKLTKFLNAIRTDISFEYRKRGPESFETTRDIAKTIKTGFKSENLENVNNVVATKDTDFYENLYTHRVFSELF